MMSCEGQRGHATSIKYTIRSLKVCGIVLVIMSGHCINIQRKTYLVKGGVDGID